MEQTSMNKKYIVRLTSQEREQLEEFISRGKRAAYKIKHANILLKADADGPGWSDESIAEAFSVHEHTVRNVRQRFVEEGLKAALERKKQDPPPRKPILDGEKQARLMAMACSQPPQGHARWTLQLLADEMVRLDVVDSISYETVRRALKKRVETAPVQVLVYSPGAQRGIRGTDGGYFGPVLFAVRPQRSAGLYG
jgi:transposase